MDVFLTETELKRLRKNQAWLGFFVELCFKYSAVVDWQIGGWVLDINTIFLSTLGYLEPLTPDNINGNHVGRDEIDESSRIEKIKALKLLLSWTDYAGLGACNEKKKKAIAIIDADENWPNNHAYLDIWDPDYINAPKLNFIGNFTEESFNEFEELFVTFMRAETQTDMDLFKTYISTTYK